MPKGIKGFIKGQKFSEEYKRKLREARKHYVFTDDIRKKLSEARKKRIFTKELKESISKGKLNSEKSKLASII
jgi:predicted RNase H-like nuclease